MRHTGGVKPQTHDPSAPTPSPRLFSPVPDKTTWRIALFTGAYNHIADGVSLTLNRLVGHLQDGGHEVVVFAPTVENPPVAHIGTLRSAVSVAAPGRGDYRMSLWLPPESRAALERLEPHFVHIATPDGLGLQALRWARSRGVPVVASYHTHFGSYLKYYRLGMLEGAVWRYLRYFYRRCEQVYVPTPAMANILREHGIDKGLYLWPRGVDTVRFNPEKRSLAWRRTLGFGDETPVVAFVSRLVWEKGLGVFADVLESLTRRGVAHHSLVVGEGPARADLQARLPETVFTGHLEGNDLAKAYASSDIFLFPSDTETFGNVTLEAMASELPTVCADAAGSRTLVEHHRTGFLAPPGDSEAFTNGVATLCTNPSQRREMGERALSRAQDYRWETVLARLEDYYRELLEARAQTTSTVMKG